MTAATNDPGFDNESRPTPDSASIHLHPAKIADIFKTEYRGLLSLVRRKVGNRELAADLLNEAIVVALEHLKSGRLKQQDQIAGYVFMVSMNLLRNHQRNLDNRHDLRSPLERIDFLQAVDTDDIETEQVRRRTLQVIESLPSSRDREVVKRFYLDEEEKQSICDSLSITPLQFTQVMSRARKRMKLAFQSQGITRNDLLSLLFLIAAP